MSRDYDDGDWIEAEENYLALIAELEARIAELELENKMYSEMLDRAHDERDVAEAGKNVFKTRVTELENELRRIDLNTSGYEGD